MVEHDERETTGLRAVLNYGHTFAHAFETVGGYGAWLHGEAVAAGMVCAGPAGGATRADRQDHHGAPTAVAGSVRLADRAAAAAWRTN